MHIVHSFHVHVNVRFNASFVLNLVFQPCTRNGLCSAHPKTHVRGDAQLFPCAGSGAYAGLHTQSECWRSQVYYFNTITSESSWTEPEGYSGEAPVSAAADVVSTTRCKGTPWSEVLCSDGRKYYLNADTDVRVWFRVLGFPSLLLLALSRGLARLMAHVEVLPA